MSVLRGHTQEADPMGPCPHLAHKGQGQAGLGLGVRG